MHELSVAVSLLQEVERIARDEKASQVLRVTVAVGEMSGIETEALETCFPLVADGTVATGAELTLVKVPLEVECRACGTRGRAAPPLLRCGGCGSIDVTIVQGRELLIQSLEVQ